jgi:hypothetical protein
MTNFKEHDGMLFKMLDKPVPLTPDAEMPCLVRLIQDNSPMGKLNKDLHAKVLTPKICTEVIDVNDLSDHNRGSVRCDGFMSCLYYYYELIGTFVEEGSAEWALYQMMQRNKVTKQHLQDDSGNIYWCFCDMLRCVQEFNCGTLQITVIPEIWINTADKNGWQIYKEPEQLNTMPVNEFADLLDAPIGWICKTRDGDSFPLKYIEVSPTRYAYEDKSGLTVYVMANGRYKKNGIDGRDIISCEHEHPKHESQYKVGDCKIEFVKQELHNLLDKI